MPHDVQTESGNYDQYYAWYWDFLEQEWAKVPADLKDTLMGGAALTHSPPAQPLANLYELLTFLAKGLTHQDRPTLTDLTTQIENKGIFKPIAGDEDSGLRNQVVFIALGWLTMLFEPNLLSTKGSIGIQPTRNVKGQIMDSELLDTVSAPLVETSDIPIHQLLKYFGTLIPTKFWTHSPTNIRAPDTFSEQIVVSCVNYGTLYRIAGITLEFTSSASLHLDFDERTKTIKIFQYPSFCMMVASGIKSAKTADGEHYVYLDRQVFNDASTLSIYC